MASPLTLKHHVTALGLFQPSLAWGGFSLLNSQAGPKPSTMAWLRLGPAWATALYATMKKVLCSSLVAIVWKHFDKDDVHVQLAHLPVQTYLTPEEIKMGKVKHISFSRNLCTP